MNTPISVPKPQETAGSIAFRGRPSGKEMKKFYQMLEKLDFDMIMKNPQISSAEKQEHHIRKVASSGVWDEIKQIVDNLLNKLSK